MSDEVENSAEDVETTFEERITEFIARLEENQKDLKLNIADAKALKRDHIRIIKKLNTVRKKKVTKDPDAPKKNPSGFAKPTRISAELATFLGLSEGDLIARPAVTKGITAYIQAHELQKVENRRIIDLTKPGGQGLIDLLKIPGNVDLSNELTFFNLQKYLKIHFPASEPKAPKVTVSKAKANAAPAITATVAPVEPVAKVEEAPKVETVAKKARASKAKKVVAAKTTAATSAVEVEELGEEVPIEDVKPRRKRATQEE